MDSKTNVEIEFLVSDETRKKYLEAYADAIKNMNKVWKAEV